MNKEDYSEVTLRIELVMDGNVALRLKKCIKDNDIKLIEK